MKKKVAVARNAGFCEGVKRAVELATKTVKKYQGQKKIFSLGRLVHNVFVVKKLQDLGVVVVNNLEEITEPGYLIISAHGVSPKIIQKAREKGLEIIDTTCPWVKKVQEIGAKFFREDFQVIIVGDKKHPEVKGVVEWSGGQALVVENPADLKNLKLNQKITVVAQTTQSAENFDEIVGALKKSNPAVVINNTICGATSKRQKSAVELAKNVEVMLVIGDQASANTRRLFELSRAVNPETFYIQSAQDLKKEMLSGKNKIGVTAGASTPEWIIREVIGKIENEIF